MTETVEHARVTKPKDLAAALGVAHSTVTRAIRDGRIRAIPVGASWRIPRDEHERIIAEGFSPAA